MIQMNSAIGVAPHYTEIFQNKNDQKADGIIVIFFVKT